MKNDAPLSRLTDAELEARIDRFVAIAAEAGERFAISGDPEDHITGEKHWLAARELSMESARRKQAREQA
jgi:hypothetical protein